MIVFLATATPRGPFRCLERARALRCRARPCFSRRSASTRPGHRPDRTWRCRPASPGTRQTAAVLVVRLDGLGLVESEGHEAAQIDGGEPSQLLDGRSKLRLLRQQIDVARRAGVDGSRQNAQSAFQREFAIFFAEHTAQQPVEIEAGDREVRVEWRGLGRGFDRHFKCGWRAVPHSRGIRIGALPASACSSGQGALPRKGAQGLPGSRQLLISPSGGCRRTASLPSQPLGICWTKCVAAALAASSAPSGIGDIFS